MELENKREDIEIDLQELFKAVLSKLVLIIFVGVVTGAIAFIYTKTCVTPLYTSSTKVYILDKPDSDNLTTSDLAFATYLARDYKVLIVSDPVLKEVISELNLNMTTRTLASIVSVNLLEDTRIIQIDVTCDSPQLAKDIADKIRDATNKKTKDAMGGVEAVNAIDEASLPIAPSSPNIVKNTMMGFLFGAGIVFVIVVILFLIDDTIKSQEDVEKYLGLSVLASIPVQKENGAGDKNKKKSKRRNREV